MGRLIACVVVVLLTVGIITIIILHRFEGSTINEANFAKIVDGMTREEVIGILGVAPGDYRSTTDKKPLSRIAGVVSTATSPPRVVRFEAWISDECKIEVGFNPMGRVEGKYLTRLQPPDPG